VEQFTRVAAAAIAASIAGDMPPEPMPGVEYETIYRNGRVYYEPRRG